MSPFRSNPSNPFRLRCIDLIVALSCISLPVGSNAFTNSGSLVGYQIDLTATHDINNVGGSIQGIGQDSTGKATSTLTARAGGNILLQTTTIDSSGLNSSRTQVDRIATVQAGHIQLDAGKNIVLAGAQFNTDGKLTLKAGQDIKTVAVIETSSLNVGNARGDYFNRSSSANVQTNLGGNNVTAIAGRAITLTGANIAAINDVTLVAKDISISAAVDSQTADQKGMTQGGYNRSAVSGQSLSGGNIVAGNNVTLVAQNTITVQAATLSAEQGQASLIAGGDIKVAGIETSRSTASDSASSSSGFLSSKSSSSSSASATVLYNGAYIGGASTVLISGGNTTVTGSDVLADGNLSISSKGDVKIEAGTSTLNTSSTSRTSASGLGALGGLSFGNRSTSGDNTDAATKSVSSNIVSLNGNVNIQAGKGYTQVGSNVIAPTKTNVEGAASGTGATGGDIAITAQTVNIIDAQDTAQSTRAASMSQSGISVSFSNPIVSTFQTVGQMADASGKAKDPRMVALAAATSVLSIKEIATKIASNPASSGAIGISISLGSASSTSTGATGSTTAVGSNVAASGNVIIIATGAGNLPDATPPGVGNINLRGSAINAGGTAALVADNQVNITAAQNTATQSNSSSSSSASIGVGFNLTGPSTGITISASGAQASGSGSGQDVTHTNSTVKAGNVLINSGGDTNIKGGVVSATSVTAVVGGNLYIASPQDASTYKETGSSSGFGISLCIPPLCQGSSSASVSTGKTNISSDFASVDTQSGIKAGDGGFNVNVAGNTTLIGGVIASTQKAVDDKANSFQTGTGSSGGTLTIKDINNSASYEAQAVSVTIGLGPKPDGKTGITGSAGFGADSASASSVTTGGVSGIAGNSAVRTGDAETGIKPIFDKEAVQGNVSSQVTITQAFLPAATTAWGQFANNKLQDAIDRDAPQDIACWSASGACRIAGHTVIGAAGGGTSGAIGAAAGTYSAPKIAGVLQEAGISGEAANFLTAVLTTGVGTAVGGPAGGVTAFNEVTNNYLSVPERLQLNQARRTCFSAQNTNSEACRTVSRLDQLDKDREVRLTNLVQNCTGTSCETVATAINTELAALGCTGPQRCEDATLQQAWQIAKTKSQGLEAVYPEEWALVAVGLASGTIKVTRGVVALVRNDGRVVIADGVAGNLARNGEGLFTNVPRTPYTPTNPVLGQAYDFSCAAASCRMAANLTNTPEAYIRNAILTDEVTGTSIANIPSGLKNLGFTGTAEYSAVTTVELISTATKNGASVIVNVRTEGGGVHAIVVDSVKGGMANIRDPWPLGIGSSYSVPVNSLGSILTGKGVVIRP